MKKLLLLSVTIVFLTSCGNKKESKAPSYGKPATEQTTKKPSEASTLISKGKKLFASKTCTTCHQIDKKGIGPSIKTISSIYKEKDASIVAFLEGKLAPIVDTDPGQVAVMKANLDSFVKNMSEDELKAIEAYMQSL